MTGASSSNGHPMAHLDALRRAHAAVAALGNGEAATREALLGRIDGAQRSSRVDIGLGADLARQLVDGNGPREADHPLFAAFAAIDEAAGREFARSVRVLPRETARSLPAGPLPSGYLRLIEDYGVFVPTVTGAADAASLRTIRRDDGHVLVPAFLSRDDLITWAGGQGTLSALVQLRELGSLLAAGPIDGIVIDPGHTDSVVPTPIGTPGARDADHRSARHGGPDER